MKILGRETVGAQQTAVEETGPASTSQATSHPLDPLRTQGQQAIGQRSLRTLGDLISTAREAHEEVISRWEQRLAAKPLVPRTLAAMIPPSERSIEIDFRMVEQELKDIPRSRRAEATRNMPLIIQDRINKGYELWKGIQEGTIHRNATPEDVRNLMTFLMAKAMEKGPGFSEGAFSIEDPEHKLKNFLTSCPEVYHRRSSHITEFQQASGGGHFGIDLPLPYGNRTLLFGEMTGLGLLRDRLFLKMETSGCRLFNFGANRSEAPVRDRPLRWRDAGQFLSHASGYLKTFLRKRSRGFLFANSSESRKERIPTEVSNSFKKLISQLRQDGKTELADTLERDNPLSSSRGIRTIVYNIGQALQDPLIDENTENLLKKFIAHLEFRYDHLDVRIGQEIVLNRDEIVESEPGTQEDRASTERLARSIMKEAFASLLAVRNPKKPSQHDVVDFLRHLTRLSLTTARKIVDVDDYSSIYHEAIEDTLRLASEEQKERLKLVLSSPPFRRMFQAVNETLMNPPEISENKTEWETSGSTISKMYALVDMLYEKSGVQVPNEKPDKRSLNLLKLVGTIAANTGINVATNISGIKYARLREYENQLLGFRSLEDIRKDIGENIFILGEPISSMLPSERPINLEGIKSKIHSELKKDLANEEGESNSEDILQSLNRWFIADFERPPGYVVNGQHFGGNLPSGTPDEVRRRELQRFIDAVGGLEKAKQIARVSHQGAFGIFREAIKSQVGDELAPRLLGHMGHQLITSEDGTARPSQERIITVDQEGIHISFKFASQLSSYVEPYNLGEHLSLDFTIVAPGSKNPDIRIDRCDFLYSASPSEETTQTA
ncbi:MAG: hypothetical protein WHS38_09510 [Thermodesulforhabdaceae bacterium]